MRATTRIAEWDRNADAFAPPRWLADRHLQTLWRSSIRRPPAADFVDEKLATPDGDFLDLLVLRGEPDSPVVLLLHGLEGSARSNYVRGAAARFAARGWTVVACEHRGCGARPDRAPRLYHAGDTEDLALAVGELRRRYPARRLYLAGFSMGGNQALKWLGIAGASSGIAGAAAVSAPFDFAASAPHIERALGGFYVRAFLATMIPRALAMERRQPGCLDPEAVRRARNFQEYDTRATAPVYGFRDCWDYYAQSSCGPYLRRIRVPTLLLSSRDDPFYPESTLPLEDARTSPWLYPCFTRRGGHLGFVGGTWRSPRYWAEEQVALFFETIERARAEGSRCGEE